jgi:hypothetical protein
MLLIKKHPLTKNSVEWFYKKIFFLIVSLFYTKTKLKKYNLV